MDLKEEVVITEKVEREDLMETEIIIMIEEIEEASTIEVMVEIETMDHVVVTTEKRVVSVAVAEVIRREEDMITKVEDQEVQIQAEADDCYV